MELETHLWYNVSRVIKMGSILDKINSPKDIKILNTKAKEELAEEVRKYILEVVSKNGGHLASNLGVVELTISLLSTFDVPNDKIIWDVGHQVYSYKILTDRKEKFKSLRKLNGIAGFPRTSESIYDSFNTGHSGTSISAALGMARVRDLKQENNKIIAVIGDGALTGGIALEALNDAGTSKTNITVILNDNEMSISPNIGGINTFLSKLRTKKLYKVSNESIKEFFNEIPGIGPSIVQLASKVKSSIKSLIIPKMYFEDIGFTYLGPVDGHDILALEKMLEESKSVEGPVLIHVLTKKGMGYRYAMDNPEKYHATGAFNLETGEPLKPKSKDYSMVFGDKLVELAKENEKIVAITASMKSGTGLTKFASMYPNRFFDIGIAEQHALTLAAGMSSAGYIPIVPIYSTFYQRGYDQVIHDIAMQNLPVIMCVDRAGLIGADGKTHQGMFDLAMFRLVPNLVIMAPRDFNELEDMLEFSITLKKPVVIRYPRGAESSISLPKPKKLKLGTSEVLNTGKDITIIAIGKYVSKAIEVQKELSKENITATIINTRFLKPLEEKTILKEIKDVKLVVTLEDGTLIGGLASAIKELMIDNNIKQKILCFGYPDEFIDHGSTEELEKVYGLDVKSIKKKIIDMYKRLDTNINNS